MLVIQTVVLKWESEMVRLLFEPSSLMHPFFPQARLLLSYMQPTNEEDLLSDMYSLSFFDIEDDALFGYKESYDPKMSE